MLAKHRLALEFSGAIYTLPRVYLRTRAHFNPCGYLVISIILESWLGKLDLESISPNPHAREGNLLSCFVKSFLLTKCCGRFLFNPYCICVNCGRQYRAVCLLSGNFGFGNFFAASKCLNKPLQVLFLLTKQHSQFFHVGTHTALKRVS